MQLCICVAVVAAAVSLLSNVGPPRARRPLLADLQLLDGTAWRLTGRLQVSRSDRNLTAEHNAAEGTVDRLLNASATFRDVWRRAAAENEWRDGNSSENVRVSDEVFVSALTRHRDAVDAKLATGLLAWAAHIGAAGACRLLVELGADVSLRPARMLGRNALHVAASRAWRDAYDAIAASADASLALERDLFGKTPDDYWTARPKTSTGGTCEIESSAFTSRELARAIYGGRPVVWRGAAKNWTDAVAAWSPETLELLDVLVEAHPIPHGEQSFGISAPRPPETLGAFVRRSFGDDVAAAACEGRCGPDDVSDLADYVFDTGDAADALVRNSSLMPRLLNILRPAPALDAALDGIPRWLHARDAHDVVQVYVGPTGAGAPFHYHENALNALLHGRKRWWLKEPSEAVYSVRHPRAWCRRGVEVYPASTPSTRRVIDRLRRRTDDAKDACTFVQEAGDVVLVPANWAHAILNEAPVVGAAFEHLDAYLIASNSRRVFA